MSARDLAATVQSKLDKATDRPLTLDERRFAADALVALEKQAADAQAALSKPTKAWFEACLRAEEALRQAADIVHEWRHGSDWMGEGSGQMPDRVAILRVEKALDAALARYGEFAALNFPAAGAVTEPEA